ncbi:MAG TPA: rRNA maturation RNase YbeY [Chitinophagales bacterium]|nr:rRNA maturation RNase YbeY [Chitinophagales bacterium]
MPITFHTADIKFKLPNTSALKTFIQNAALKHSGKKLNISYVFCSDEFLLDINQRFLNHNYYTDIITFPLSETEKTIEAEIYISIPRITENAQKLKLSFEEELHRVIFHGVLHLLGYNDKPPAQKAAMRKAEDEWLKALPLRSA